MYLGTATLLATTLLLCGDEAILVPSEWPDYSQEDFFYQARVSFVFAMTSLVTMGYVLP